MKIFSVLVLSLILASACAIPNASSASLSEKTISVSGDDPEMNAAIAKARSTLPQFWAHFAKPNADEDYFAVKLKLTDGTHVEHFWCDNIQGDESGATCIIGNEPQSVMTVKIGQRMPIDFEMISDWMIRTKGKIVGGESIRVLLPKMDKAEAESLRAMLADEK